MSRELSKMRLYVMRFYYLLGILLAIDVWPRIIRPGTLWDPLQGVAYSFWAALSILLLFGARFPLRMLPLLLLQLFYKVVWLIGVAYPLWSAGHLDPANSGLFKACAIGAALDLIVIPWPHVFENYIKAIFKREAEPNAFSL